MAGEGHDGGVGDAGGFEQGDGGMAQAEEATVASSRAVSRPLLADWWATHSLTGFARVEPRCTSSAVRRPQEKWCHFLSFVAP